MTASDRCDELGLPAISADGRVVATLELADDQGGAQAGLTVRFHDVRTSQIVSELVALDDDPYSSQGAPFEIPADRIAPIQRALDAGRFRALVPVDRPGLPSTGRSALRAEYGGGWVRLYDLWDHGTVAWAAQITWPLPPSGSPLACPNWSSLPDATTTWWDPWTKIVVVRQRFGTVDCPTRALHVVLPWSHGRSP